MIKEHQTCINKINLSVSLDELSFFKWNMLILFEIAGTMLKDHISLSLYIAFQIVNIMLFRSRFTLHCYTLMLQIIGSQTINNYVSDVVATLIYFFQGLPVIIQHV